MMIVLALLALTLAAFPLASIAMDLSDDTIRPKRVPSMLVSRPEWSAVRVARAYRSAHVMSTLQDRADAWRLHVATSYWPDAIVPAYA